MNNDLINLLTTRAIRDLTLNYHSYYRREFIYIVIQGLRNNNLKMTESVKDYLEYLEETFDIELEQNLDDEENNDDDDENEV